MDIEARSQNYQDNNILYGPAEERSDEISSSKSLLNNPHTRLQFVRKVFSILFCQLLITTIASYLSMNESTVAIFQMSNPAVLIFSSLIGLSILIAVFCSKDLARIVPTNYILLAIFTLSESYFVSSVCASVTWNEKGESLVQGKEIVYMAALMTLGVTASLVVYAFNTKNDITIMGGFLFVGISVFLLFSFMLFFVSELIFELIYCCITSLIYSFYIIYDTQLIMGGRTVSFTVDDYILGSMMLYIDIVRVFLKLLQFFMRKR